MKALSTCCLALTLLVSSAASSEDRVYALIDIDAIGPAALQALKDKVAPAWSVEADQSLLVLAPRGKLRGLDRAVRVLDTVPDEKSLFVVREAHDLVLDRLESDVLVKGGRQAVVQARTAYLENIVAHPSIERFTPDTVLARQAANEPAPAQLVPFSDEVSRLVEQVDGQRWLRDATALARYNRYTHGTQIAEARQWLVDQLAALPGMTVTTESFRVGSTTAYNVVAKLTGTSRPDDWYIVGAHYDATSQSPSTAAPGAEDNGSGTAGLLELARIMAEARPAATIWFIAYSGEEQGLHGSRAHAKKLVAEGDKAKVKAMLNMDMIGFTRDDDLDCLLESDRRGADALFDTMKAAAARFTTLRIVTSLNPFGSDHVPYIQEGIPALLTIENDWDEYPSYHRTTDTVEKLSVAMAEQTLRMKAATLATLTAE